MKYIRIPSLLFLLSVALGSISGCSKSSTSPETTATLPSIPTVGSSFIMLDNNSITTYDTVVATTLLDTAHHGSTVREFNATDASNGGTYSMFQSFLTNGDLAISGTSWGPTGVFEALPFASHTTVTTTFFDQGTSSTDTITAVYHSGSAAYVLNKQSYATDSVTVTAYSQGTVLQYYYTYIPAIGLIANYARSDGYSQWLTSYTAK